MQQVYCLPAWQIKLTRMQALVTKRHIYGHWLQTHTMTLGVMAAFVSKGLGPCINLSLLRSTILAPNCIVLNVLRSTHHNSQVLRQFRCKTTETRCALDSKLISMIMLQIQHYYAHSPAFPSNMYERTIDKYDMGYHHERMIMPKSQDMVFDQHRILVSAFASGCEHPCMEPQSLHERKYNSYTLLQ